MPNTQRARDLRQKQTWAERLMWSWLRDRRYSAYKFRRGFSIGIYFLDFYCREASLSIELDGGQHGFPAQRARDIERTKFLTSMGIKELRFWNGQLRREKQYVRDVIFSALQERAPVAGVHESGHRGGKEGLVIWLARSMNREESFLRKNGLLALTPTLSPGERETALLVLRSLCRCAPHIEGEASPPRVNNLCQNTIILY